MNGLRYCAYRHKGTKEFVSHTPYLGKAQATAGLYSRISYLAWPNHLHKDEIVATATADYELVEFRLEECSK